MVIKDIKILHFKIDQKLGVWFENKPSGNTEQLTLGVEKQWTNSGLPDLSWHNTPKRGKCTKSPQNTYTKWP
jgi:hypothetical protein